MTATDYGKILAAMDLLHSATTHVRRQFTTSMSRDEAQANLDARAIMIQAALSINLPEVAA